MQDKKLIVRAVDVGYGHVKFTDGCDADSGIIRTSSIPSQSPPASNQESSKDIVAMSQRDTFFVPVGGQIYEVGRDVRLALHSNHISEVLDDNFAISDAYTARLFGAINYMLPGLPDHVIDVLVLGLPLNTFAKHHKALQNRFIGPHVINQSGATVDIRSCTVYPQPLGSYMDYLSTAGLGQTTPMALIVDPGYNTVDWFVCEGVVVNNIRSDAVQRGMGAVMSAMAVDLIKKRGFDATPVQVTRAIDRAFVHNQMKIDMYGTTVDLTDYIPAGKGVIGEAAQAIKNNVGPGSDIDVILLTGGGAWLYAEAVQNKFPMHKVITLPTPALANVCGFHTIGERLALSRQRALNRAAISS